MTAVSRSLILLIPPARIWTALTSFAHWGYFITLPDAENKGWGDRWAVLEGSGPGTKLGLYSGEKLMQEWQVEQWTPPTKLRVTSTAWHGKGSLAMQSAFDFTITANSEVETKLDIVLETRFSNSLLGIFFAMIPLKKELDGVLARLEDRLVNVLSGA